MKQKNQSIHIHLVSDSPETVNKPALNQLTKQLYDEINRLEVHQLQIKSQTEVPAGAKMIEFAVAANVIIELIPHLVPPLMKLLTDWVKTRRAQKDIAMNMQIGNKTVTITPTMTEDDIVSEIKAITGLLQDNSDKTNRYALIIGTSEYEDNEITKLQAPNSDVTSLAEVLQDKKIGAFDDVTVLLNKTALEVKQTIERFYKNRIRSDTLLLYFSGHGIKGDNGKLFLAARDTYRDVLRSTGISDEFIASVLDGSFSQRKILILDCCYSGAFAKGSKSAVLVGQSVNDISAFSGNGFGQVIITASDAMQYAWEGDRIIGDTRQSLFTHYLVQGLKTGKADGDQDGMISLADLYEYTYNQVVPHQTPSITSTDMQGKLIIAHNPFPTIQPAKLSHELIQSINSKVVWQKEGAIGELKRIMLTSQDPGLALAAKNHLQALAEDDSRRVSTAALAALAAATSVTPSPPPPPTPHHPPPMKPPQTTLPPKPKSNDSIPKRTGRYWGSLVLTAILSFILGLFTLFVGLTSAYVGIFLLAPLVAWVIVKAALKLYGDNQNSTLRNPVIGAFTAGSAILLFIDPTAAIIYLAIATGTFFHLFKKISQKAESK